MPMTCEAARGLLREAISTCTTSSSLAQVMIACKSLCGMTDPRWLQDSLHQILGTRWPEHVVLAYKMASLAEAADNAKSHPVDSGTCSPS